MKMMILTLTVLASTSVFAQSHYRMQSCMSLTRTLSAKNVICTNELKAIETAAADSNTEMKMYAACLSKSDDICVRSLLAGEKLEQARFYERNSLASEISCQNEMEATTKDGTSAPLKALSQCLDVVMNTHLEVVK